MKSMTGYGRAEYKDNCIDLLVEIKSVNNRNLDVSAKLPRSFIAFEDALRKCVQKKLRRGRVDVFVSFADNREKTAELNVDYALAESYVAAAKALAARCGVVAMHMQGRPETMQDAPSYGDVVREVRGYFEERYDFLLGRGLEPEQICWDPGIGFGKTAEHNLALLSNMDKLQVAGRPVLLGLSRKRMLGAVLGDAEQGRAPLSTAVMTVWGHLHGAQIHRVHDVAECARALRLIRAAEPFVR